MKPHRIAIACVITALLLAACASAPHPQAASAAPTDVIAPATSASAALAASASVAPAAAGDVVAADVATPASSAALAGGTVAANAASNDAVDDFDAIYGNGASDGNGATASSGAYDPWEKYNRHMHAFNIGVDKYVAHPLAKAYVTVLPQAVRNRVGDFFDNLGSPVTMVNQLLQGRPSDAWKTLGRFMLNSTVGIGGLFDPATRAKIAHKHDDFGQTLAVWGWRKSRYFELPFFGPRTLRDTFGLAGDIPLSPTHYVQDDTVRYGLDALELVDTRAQLLSTDSMRQGAADDYALVRDAWTQHRNYQILRDLHPKKGAAQQDSSLPDYLREQPDDEQDQDRKDVPANAIPIPAATVPVR